MKRREEKFHQYERTGSPIEVGGYLRGYMIRADGQVIHNSGRRASRLGRNKDRISVGGREIPLAEVLAGAFGINGPRWQDVAAKPFFMPGPTRGLRDICWDFPRGFAHHCKGGVDVGWTWVEGAGLAHGRVNRNLKDDSPKEGQIYAKISRYGAWLTEAQFLERVYGRVTNKWDTRLIFGRFRDEDPAHIWQGYMVIPIPWYAMVPFGELIPRTKSRVVHKEKKIMLHEDETAFVEDRLQGEVRTIYRWRESCV